MGKIIYLEDRKNGLHCYTPEMGERKPEVKMEASLSYYGKHYFVDTPLELKGRGITEVEAHWVDGCQKQIENWRTYRVTKAAFGLINLIYGRRCCRPERMVIIWENLIIDALEKMGFHSWCRTRTRQTEKMILINII